MTEFESETCINKLLQGCTYTAGKCPCKLKKTASEEEYDKTQTYVKKHWKSVVLCKECKHYETDGNPNVCELMYAVTPEDGWCWNGERDEEERT